MHHGLKFGLRSSAEAAFVHLNYVIRLSPLKYDEMSKLTAKLQNMVLNDEVLSANRAPCRHLSKLASVTRMGASKLRYCEHEVGRDHMGRCLRTYSVPRCVLAPIGIQEIADPFHLQVCCIGMRVLLRIYRRIESRYRVPLENSWCAVFVPDCAN